jgi:Rod binding domain-containing protein
MVVSGIGQIGSSAGERANRLERAGLEASAGASGEDFAPRLDDALHRVSAPEERTIDRSALREKIHGMAEELVSGAFVRPVLAKMRETNQAAPPFAPGRWEKTFGPMMDEQISKNIVESSRFPLVDTLTEQLMAKVHSPVNQEADHG